MSTITADGVGGRFAVTTDSGESFEGDCFAYDPASMTVVFHIPLEYTTVKSHIRMLSTRCITDLKWLGKSTTMQPVSAGLPALSKERLAHREQEAMKKAVLKASQVGVGVTDDAQKCFDALVKTMPCEWDGQTIVVLGTTRITAPYTPESCSGSDAPAVERIRRVLAEERAKWTA